jgi:hypothetical protein
VGGEAEPLEEAADQDAAAARERGSRRRSRAACSRRTRSRVNRRCSLAGWRVSSITLAPAVTARRSIRLAGDASRCSKSACSSRWSSWKPSWPSRNTNRTGARLAHAHRLRDLLDGSPRRPRIGNQQVVRDPAVVRRERVERGFDLRQESRAGYLGLRAHPPADTLIRPSKRDGS